MVQNGVTVCKNNTIIIVIVSFIHIKTWLMGLVKKEQLIICGKMKKKKGE